MIHPDKDWLEGVLRVDKAGEPGISHGEVHADGDGLNGDSQLEHKGAHYVEVEPGQGMGHGGVRGLGHGEVNTDGDEHNVDSQAQLELKHGQDVELDLSQGVGQGDVPGLDSLAQYDHHDLPGLDSGVVHPHRLENGQDGLVGEDVLIQVQGESLGGGWLRIRRQEEQGVASS